MNHFKTSWIIGIGNSAADNVIINRVFGTKRQVKKHLLKLAKDDKEVDRDIWNCGTDNVNEVETRKDGSFYAFNNFADYHIDYVAVPEGPLTLLEG